MLPRDHILSAPASTRCPQVWTAAAVLLDRLARQGYQAASEPLLAAACVVVAGTKEGIPVDSVTLAAGLNLEVSVVAACVGASFKADYLLLGKVTINVRLLDVSGPSHSVVTCRHAVYICHW